MNDEKIKEIVALFAQEARKQYGSRLSAVILYGSCARGDYKDDSDINIMVLLDVPAESIPDERTKMREVANNLSWEYDVLISPTYQSHATFERYKQASAFYRHVEHEGLRVG